MSTNLVIVAIPEENDRVWKISSEKVPHLTLLFLGEADNNPHVSQIVQFVQHATELSEHGQFYLDVDYRGMLGDAEADVLYFSKRSWNLKWIKQFRGQLLQNQQIRSAYDAVPQHTAPQDWLPHLTLGYPDTPARPLPDDGFDHPIYSVCFDRIAVWDTEFDGPEFRLEWPDRELEGDLAIAYSDTQKAALMHSGRLTASPVTAEQVAEFVEHHGISKEEDLKHAVELGADFLEHYGTKGMKWGVRNTSRSTSKPRGLFNREPPKAVKPKATSKVPHGSLRKTKIETEGGENHPAHEDALTVAKSVATLKKSGTKALSNKELQDLTNRIRLEEQATQATRSAGSKWIRKFLGGQGNQAANQVVRTEVDSRIRSLHNK